MAKKTDNGLTVTTKEMPHMESVSFGIWIRTGVRYETKANNGVSHLLEHLLFKGTENRDMKKIKEEIEGRGGSFNGFTAEEFTCYLVKMLSKDAELGVDILSDMVLNPRLDGKEVEKEKGVVIEEINMYKDIPAQHVHEILTEMLWPGQPLGFPLAGSVGSVNALTRKDIVAYKDAHYNPANMLLAGAGRIKEEDLIDLSKKYLSKASSADAPGFEDVRRLQNSPNLILNFKETEQTHMALGFHAPDRFSPDRYALSILNIILGANMSSRLFHIVRDEMALCYEISSSTRKYYDTGALVVSAGLEERKLKNALEVIFAQLGKMKKEPVQDEELERAKEFYKGQLLFTMEDTMSLMLWHGEKVAAGEKELDAKKIMKNVEAVAKDDIMRVASGVLKDDNLNLAVIGPVRDEKGLKGALHVS
jgi:predicted Zn-dependent peptidase